MIKIKPLRHSGIITLFSLLATFGSAVQSETLDLSGTWQIRLDPDNVGLAESWQTQDFTETLQLPGCLQEQGYGNIPSPETEWFGDKKLSGWGPRWLQNYRDQGIYKIFHFLMPDRHYIGPAWYSRTFDIPETWDARPLSLSLERVHWESQLWLNGNKIGQSNSLATPHLYELGALEPGTHRITLRVDNSEIVHMGKWAHSVSEQTAGTWNGIVGKIELHARPSVWIDKISVSPKPVDGMLKVSVLLGKSEAADGEWQLTLDATGSSHGKKHDPAPISLIGELNEIDGSPFRIDYPVTEDALLWDEFDPNLYLFKVKVTTKSSIDSRELVFGLRNIATEDMHLTMNGIKTFMRGNVDCAVMPATGYAPMDVESWRKVWKTYKDFGLNLARFHSWCPPEAAFVAANEIGLYLAPEVGEWAVVDTEDQFNFMREEAKRILDTFGHHPSFVMMGLGNEYGGNRDFFTDLIDDWKAHDDSKLYTVKANSWNPPNTDFQVQRGIGPKRSIKLRYQSGWPPLPDRTEYNLNPPQTTIDWREATAMFDVPVMQHETAQICTYPNIEVELAKYTGYLTPNYLEIARDQLKERGMYELLPQIVESSGRWQIELIREAFEASFRTPNLAGFHWLSLADFTGQSSAPVGLVDPFYDPRPYVDLEYISRWSAPTALLARIPERILTKDDRLRADIEVSHFGKEELHLDDLTATLRTESGFVVKKWTLPQKSFSQNTAQAIASIDFPLGDLEVPAKLNLQVESEANALQNDWNLWVYPHHSSAIFPLDIHVSSKWDDETQKRLKEGETVLLLPRIGDMRGNLPSCFTNHFWTAVQEKGGQSSASGMLIDPKHPLFAHFPTDSHVNWNWWDILNNCQPMILDSYDSKTPWPKAYRSLVQPIDSWKLNRKLSLVAEAKVGSGKILICSIDLESDLENRPATRQFRKSLISYLQSPDFEPQWEIQADAIAEVFQKESNPAKKIDFDAEALPTDN